MLYHLLRARELVRSVLRSLWTVDTRDMVADGLTKGSIGRKALLELGNGIWNIRGDAATGFRTIPAAPGSSDK